MRQWWRICQTPPCHGGVSNSQPCVREPCTLRTGPYETYCLVFWIFQTPWRIVLLIWWNLFKPWATLLGINNCYLNWWSAQYQTLNKTSASLCQVLEIILLGYQNFFAHYIFLSWHTMQRFLTAIMSDIACVANISRSFQKMWLIVITWNSLVTANFTQWINNRPSSCWWQCNHIWYMTVKTRIIIAVQYCAGLTLA